MAAYPNDQSTLQRLHYPLHKLETKPSSAITPKASVLVVDPDSTWLPQLRERLEDCVVHHRTETDAARELFLARPIDLVLLHHGSGMPCFELLSQFKNSKPSVPVLILAEQGSESLAVDVFRKGARDYFPKPLQLDELERVLRTILALLKALEQPLPTPSASGLEKALSTIHAHFRASLTLSRVAEDAGMSISTFVRRFKQCTGMTFVDYVNGLRISNACKLLKSSRLSLLDISLSCGFSQQAHFNRVFKKFSGMTPGQYRKGWDK